MNPSRLIEQLQLNAERIQALVTGVSNAQACWKPGPQDWSILEVVNHLYEEEIFDFRAHLDVTLHHPEAEWPAIDPQGWVLAHGYLQRDLGRSLQNFLDERQASLQWLRGLAAPDWDCAFTAPWGSMRAGDLLSAWAAHDVLHMRQLVELQYAFVLDQAAPYSVAYAGDW
jgi:hypothetical protein